MSEHDDAPDGARSSGIPDNALPEAYDTMSEPIYDARTFWELVERRVVDSPDRAFLIDPGGDGWPERTVTFA